MDPRLAPMQQVVGFHYQGRDLCFPMSVADQLSDGQIAFEGIQGTFAVRQAGGILDVVGLGGQC